VMLFEGGDADFLREWRGRDAELRRRLEEARQRLPSVRIPEETLSAVVEVIAELGVAGHRGDITTLKCARALAAIEGLPAPDEGCLRDAFRLALPHRLKEDPFEETAAGRRRLEAVLARFGVLKEPSPWTAPR